MEREQVLNRAFNSVKWSALSSILPRLITPLSTILLAALLTPEDFGTVAVATFIVTLAQVVVGLGMGQAVIQRRDQVDEAASIGLLLSLTVALVLYVGLWFASSRISIAYHNADLVDVIRVSSLALFLNALYAIPNALLQREMQFKRLFWIGVAPLITTAAVSVALAAAGARYWALVFGTLSGLLVNVILVWRLCPWRPKPFFNMVLTRQLLNFSLWIMVSGFLSWLFLYADNAIAGIFLNTKDLGQYALGFNVANLLPGMVVSTLSTVAYPSFCALQEDSPRMGDNLLKTQTQASILVIPACLGISALSMPLISLLYGSKWPELGMVISWLVIMPGMSHLWSLYADAFRAIGKPAEWAYAAGITLVVMLPSLALAGSHGLHAFVITRAAAHFLYPILLILIGKRVLSLGFRMQVKGLLAPLMCALVMYAAVMGLRSLLEPFAGLGGWLKVGVIAAFGAGIYGSLLWLFRRELFMQLLTSLRRVMST